MLVKAVTANLLIVPYVCAVSLHYGGFQKIMENEYNEQTYAHIF